MEGVIYAQRCSTESTKVPTPSHSRGSSNEDRLWSATLLAPVGSPLSCPITTHSSLVQLVQANFSAQIARISTQAQAGTRSCRGWGVVPQEQPALTLKSAALTPSSLQCHQCSSMPSPPEPLQLAGRILERAIPRQSQGAEYFDIVEYSLALPIPLLYLVPKQGEKKGEETSS